jgi:hypothetical protein
VLATLERHNQANHLLVDSEAFVDDPEAVAQRVARFVEVPYRAPDDPGRIAQAGAVEPSVRPWKRDAVGPVRRIEHEDQVEAGPLAPETMELWQQVRELMDPPDSSTDSSVAGVDR